MKNVFACVFCTALTAAGCASIPFEPIALVPLGDVEAARILESAAGRQPERFVALNSIVFRIRWHSMAALGYTRVDCPDETYSVVALNPVGVKLFEFSGKGDEVKSHYVMEPLAERGDVAGTIARDIRRIYFDRIPSGDAAFEKGEMKAVFRRESGNGVLTHVFGGKDLLLIEKGFRNNRGRIWTVSYYDYRLHDGKLYPGGIVFRHHRRGYTLTVKLKEVERD